jgi:hypothetical protein
MRYRKRNYPNKKNRPTTKTSLRSLREVAQCPSATVGQTDPQRTKEQRIPLKWTDWYSVLYLHTERSNLQLRIKLQMLTNSGSTWYTCKFTVSVRYVICNHKQDLKMALVCRSISSYTVTPSAVNSVVFTKNTHTISNICSDLNIIMQQN